MALQSTQQLKERLRRIARRERDVAALAGVAKLAIALVLFSAVFFLVDWLFLLSVAARVCLLLGGVGAAVWVAKTELWDPLRRRRDEITTALEIERRFPDLRDRLISVVQLSEAAEGVSPVLLEKLEAETARMTAPLNFADVIDWRFFRRILLVCVLMLGAGFFSAVVFPQYVAATFRRMFFGDARYPSLTQIALRSAPLRLVQGDDWKLELGLSGKIPSAVTLKTRTVSPAAAGSEHKWASVPVRPIIGYTYGLVLEKVQDPFEFQVFAGDAWTEPAVVTVLVPVAVLDPLVDAVPPAYSGLKPVKDAPVVGAAVLEGSTVTVKVPVTKPLAGGVLSVTGEASVPVKPQGETLTGVASFVALYQAQTSGVAGVALAARNGAIGFTVKVKDRDGLNNSEPLALYSLRVQKDLPPKVVIVSPGSDRLSVPYAEWKIACEATDDYGVRKAWLVWDVFPTEAADAKESGSSSESGSSGESGGARAPRPLRSGRAEIPIAADAVQWSGVATLDMVAAKAAPGETLFVWVEAVDARGETREDARGRSQVIRLSVVDENDKWAEIQGRLQAIEEGVIRMQDRQETVKKEVEALRKRQ